MKEIHSLITAIPGIGYHMAAIILAKSGNLSCFHFPDKLLAYADILPSTYQSRQLKTVIHIWRNEAPNTCVMLSSIQASMSAFELPSLLPILLKNKPG